MKSLFFQQLLTLSFFLISIGLTNAAHFKIGGLAFKGDAVLFASYNETFDTYLNAYFAANYPADGHTFELIALDFTTSYSLPAAGTIDFMFTQPSLGACMELEFNAHPIASLLYVVNGVPLTQLGGVIFAK